MSVCFLFIRLYASNPSGPRTSILPDKIGAAQLSAAGPVAPRVRYFNLRPLNFGSWSNFLSARLGLGRQQIKLTTNLLLQAWGTCTPQAPCAIDCFVRLENAAQRSAEEQEPSKPTLLPCLPHLGSNLSAEILSTKRCLDSSQGLKLFLVIQPTNTMQSQTAKTQGIGPHNRSRLQSKLKR
jgi:hypothetical protein